jgi:hypothetical protein
MDIFNYNPITHEFTGSGVADPDPLEPGKFLVPAYATTDPIPATGENQTAVRVRQAWQVLADHRGLHYWLADGSDHYISAIGDEPPANALTTEPPVLLKQRSTAIEKLKRDEGQYEPITVAGVTYDANEQGQRNIKESIDNFELLDAALRGDGTLDWTLADNKTKAVTKLELIAVKNAVVLRYAGLHLAYTAFKDAQN